jgi:hypothetical protein
MDGVHQVRYRESPLGVWTEIPPGVWVAPRPGLPPYLVVRIGANDPLTGSELRKARLAQRNGWKYTPYNRTENYTAVYG